MGYTSEDMIADVKRHAFVPTAQNTFTDQDFLEHLNHAMTVDIIPTMLDVREEFYVDYIDYPVIAGKLNYPIPYRSIGSKVRDLYLVDMADETAKYQMGRIEPENEPFSRKSERFFVQGNYIVFTSGDISPTYKLRMKYFLRPSELVLSTRCATITAIDTTNKICTVSSVPANITSLTMVDFVQHRPIFQIMDYDLACVVDSVAKTITFTDALPDELMVGDYICLAGETPVPQIPAEMISILTDLVASEVMTIQGDFEGGDKYRKMTQGNLKAQLTLLDNRIEGKSHKIVSYASPFFRGSFAGGRRRY